MQQPLILGADGHGHQAQTNFVVAFLYNSFENVNKPESCTYVAYDRVGGGGGGMKGREAVCVCQWTMNRLEMCCFLSLYVLTVSKFSVISSSRHGRQRPLSSSIRA